NQDKLSELMQEIYLGARFDEQDRLRELVSQIRARREQSVTNNGHGLAMGAAVSAMAPAAALSYRLNGLEGIRWIKQLDQTLEADQARSEERRVGKESRKRVAKYHKRNKQ